MSQIRKAYSVEIIDKRLRDAEAAVATDAMELIGLHDELSRVERKWLEKSAGVHQPTSAARKRPLANATMMNARAERLRRLVDARLRKPITDPAERALLERVAAALRERTSLPQT